ncbi:Pre-mRNA splicing factor-domain-containing protein [Sphaerosporella brunnea]|uniref:Pre-mRNA splicing factor-domain-containing protein n=1 Tax=Sphaerosporella brunnea TaxID=1250544 RepID=A0A5J5EXQ3_9PEZI|nr:Pre-mRNA splicing factor-domain-containing protein [Sphaerosporella brunnea]
MGGDLNLKKSWHPQLFKNQERVWAAEKSALAERKKTEQLLKERAEERALLELRQIQEATGGKKVLDRVEFLYSGPSEGPGGRTEEEREAYLLGKRSVVGLLKGQDNEKLKKEGFEMGVAGGAAVNARDTAAKVREDPLLAIKRREQEALKALVSDPARRRRLQAAVGGEKEDRREKDRSSRRRHHRSRSRSPRRDRDRDRGRDERRERSREGGRDRSRSPLRRDRDERRYHHHRSRSPRRDRDEKRADRNRSPRRDKEDRHSHRHHHRLRSPRKDRERSPPRRYDDRPRLRPPRSDYNHGSRPSPPPRSPPIDEEAERAKRLAEMQSNAAALDADRAVRLKALEEKEKAAAAKEEAARLRNQKLGGRARFLNKAHRQAGELDLAERVGRGRQGMGQGKDEVEI